MEAKQPRAAREQILKGIGYTPSFPASLRVPEVIRAGEDRAGVLRRGLRTGALVEQNGAQGSVTPTTATSPDTRRFQHPHMLISEGGQALTQRGVNASK